ncbi:GntR family transcriptional regulator [Mycetocola sp. BIGb0189]|uniref:GntR family transcriptional regulator n=1 Tax=unclassified Mycetocola TaxID=2685235 RepID=UPI00165D1437|nr:MULTISPECIES: GntR family transcriptional regulator [unclassified Mycetocola]MCS4275851.1 GntR family transcriptional regulator [Mycetocola sp. BIGb0189]
MFLTVDPQSPVTLYEQLAASVRAGILDGSIAHGERLPSARELAGSLDLNVHTVLRAYQALREEGLLDLRRGRGAVITAPSRDLAEVTAALDALIGAASAARIGPDTLISLVRARLSSTQTTQEGPR